MGNTKETDKNETARTSIGVTVGVLRELNEVCDYYGWTQGDAIHRLCAPKLRMIRARHPANATSA